jgi:hypothetical protein
VVAKALVAATRAGAAGTTYSAASITRASLLWSTHFESYGAAFPQGMPRFRCFRSGRAPDLLTRSQQLFSGMSRDPLSCR